MRMSIEHIDDLLKEREAAFPQQDSSYQRLIQACETIAYQWLDEAEAQQSTWKVDGGLVRKTSEFIDQPIFICGGMKTGTTLLAQLLDNHPSLLVMPGDSNYISRFKDYQGTYEELSVFWIQRLINPTGQSPFWFFGKHPQHYIDFLIYLKYYLQEGFGIFQAVVASVFCANPNRSMETMFWVEKQPENEKYVKQLIDRYPSAKFIHMIRDPLVNLASIKKLGSYGKFGFRAIAYSVRLKYLLKIASSNAKKIGDRDYKLLKYEHLTQNTKEEITEIADHLGIQLTESLFIPSLNGIPAKANSMYEENRTSGVIANHGNNQRWKRVLTKWEKEQIVTVLSPVAESFDYTNWSEKPIKDFRQKQGLKAMIIYFMRILYEIKYRYLRST